MFKRSQNAFSIPCSASLDAVLIRGDGSHRDLGNLSGGPPIAWWRALWSKLRLSAVIPMALGFAAFMSMYGGENLTLLMGLPLFGLVTTTGVNFMATDFAAGLATPRISSFNFHDSGTGTTAAAIGDSALQTQAGPATRATGVQSNPSSGQYRTVGTIAYVSTLAITEWGVFNQAAQGGTMWDHRIFGAINVVSGESIQYTYTLTVTAGGS